ncbi:MAG: bifunctional biotin--[acetyl-CoA-carboxylase] ligase/biotin operon repressor BirA [Pseudomonadales bacterium]
MTSCFQVLQIIADGNTHSGQKLSGALGVSRAAIWKHIHKLESHGVDISKEKGRGYKLAAPLELLNQTQIMARLTAEQQALLTHLYVESVVDSTNALAMQDIEQELSGSVWLAEQQTAGRGRRGRGWVSPFGANIYLSALWKISGGAGQLGGLSLALGVALVEALAALGVIGLALKWPNDIVFERKKLGGILVEMQGDAAGDCHVVVGIGMNVKMPASAAQHIDQEWTDIKSICDVVPGRNELAATLTGAVLELLSRYTVTGFAPYASRWNALDALQDTAVSVQIGADVITGVAKGAAADGALRLETAKGMRVFHGGEVSLRAQI